MKKTFFYKNYYLNLSGFSNESNRLYFYVSKNFLK